MSAFLARTSFALILFIFFSGFPGDKTLRTINRKNKLCLNSCLKRAQSSQFINSCCPPEIKMTCNLHIPVIIEQIIKKIPLEWMKSKFPFMSFFAPHKINVCSQQCQIQFVQLITAKENYETRRNKASGKREFALDVFRCIPSCSLIVIKLSLKIS